ncbi:MAG: NUDIX hydrolase [Halobacteriales archaeon]|nr:NUDIX hydrolase [Halobacteriales archaeon]
MPLFGSKKFEAPEQPHHWVNSEGTGLRLQCFLVVRDADQRIACVRLKSSPDQWSLPAESFKPSEHPDDAARRVGEMWFGSDLKPKLVGFQNYPDDGDQRWYLLFLYEAHAPKGGFKLPEDTAEIAFAPAGKPPGEFAMDHGSVFASLR